MTGSSGNPTGGRVVREISGRAGIGFKLRHAEAILAQRPDLGWIEVHPENYMVGGGPRHAILEELRQHYPLSLHGVALSLGGAEPLDRAHLRSLRAMIDRYQPGLVSEHLAWSAHGGVYFADLLPVPLTGTALRRFCGNVDQAQQALGRQILIENPANYLRLPGAEIPEPEFLAEAARRTGCGLLVDVTNIYISATNLGDSAAAYIDTLPTEAIGEIHLAGYVRDAADRRVLIDNHGAAVADETWALYRRLIRRCGPKPNSWGSRTLARPA